MRIVTEKRSSLPTRTLENSTVDTRCPMAGSGTKTNSNFFIFTRLASSTEDIYIYIYILQRSRIQRNIASLLSVVLNSTGCFRSTIWGLMRLNSTREW